VGGGTGFSELPGGGVTRGWEDTVGRGVRGSPGVGRCRTRAVVASVLGVGSADLAGLVVVTGVGGAEPSPGQPVTDSGVPVNSPPTMVTTDTNASVPTTTPAILRSRLRLPV
jgi:hypothetical protein